MFYFQLLFSRDVLKGNYRSFYFRLKEVRIIYNFCPECDILQKFNENTNTTDAHYFLPKFKNDTDTSDFCLAHLLTFKDFPSGESGLAYSEVEVTSKGTHVILLPRYPCIKK